MADQLRDCPYCKESVKADAVKCKHCGSRIGAPAPQHGGTCPYCKESIHPDAVLCKHCRSPLNGRQADCDCHDPSRGVRTRRDLFQQGRIPLGRLARQAGRRPGGFGAAQDCDTVCEGSTLWCICRVHVPGFGDGVIMYPCGSCIDDPILTAFV